MFNLIYQAYLLSGNIILKGKVSWGETGNWNETLIGNT